MVSGDPLVKYRQQIQASASRWGVDPGILGAIILHESGGRPGIVNPSSGASGLGQIMPATAAGYGLTLSKLRGTTASDAAYQIDAAAQVLSGFQKQTPGNETAALEGYGGKGSNLRDSLFNGGFVSAAKAALGILSPLNSISGPLNPTSGDFSNPVGSVTGAADSIGSAVTWFTDPQNWIRVLLGVTGLALVIGGILHAAGSNEQVREAAETAAIAA